MSEDSVEARRLDSWKEIAAYIGRSVRTVIRWEHLNGLPIHRLPGGQRQGVFAWRHEIDEWLQSDLRGQENEPEAAADLSDAEEAEGVELETVPRPKPRWFRAHIGWLHGIVAATALLVVGAFAAHSRMIPRRMRISDVAQVTSDGIKKYGLATNGKYLYFGEALNGKIVLSQVPVNGGQISAIPTPFPNAIPEAISPDGNYLLVRAPEGDEDEQALWIVPTGGGVSMRVGNVLCHAAAWARDGRIAFATGNSLYITADRGATTQLVRTFAGVAQQLEWSARGNQLILQLQQTGSSRSVLWEITFNGEASSSLRSLFPLNVKFEECCRKISPFDKEGRLFYATGRLNHEIGVLNEDGGRFGPRFTSGILGSQMAKIAELAPDTIASRLFVLGNTPGHGELLLFDRKSSEFKPFLPGTEASEVDFSKDGKWITYISQWGDAIWISRPDGSQKRRLYDHADDVGRPHWSPDGKWIAFMAHPASRPWRIFIVPTAGGPAREASGGDDEQGVPTWSPDSRWLLYGKVNCLESNNCELRKINISNGQVATVPGSEGYSNARWSPDGRWIAAVRPATHQLFVLDLATQHWRKLGDGLHGSGSLLWSPDSSSLYTINLNRTASAVQRVGLRSGNTETVVDLASFSHMPGTIGHWFGVAPDGSVIILRWLDGGEIFSLDYDER